MSRAPLATINTKEDPEKLFQLIEIIGTGSYGDVYKVISSELNFKRFVGKDER